MERVRSGKTQYVAAPAGHALAPQGPGPVLLSKDERHQLRVVKHRAFQRHQQNAMWTRSVFVFDGVTHRLSTGDSSSSSSTSEETARGAESQGDSEHHYGGGERGAHAEEEARLRDQLAAKTREIESTKQQIAQFEQDQQRNQARFEELVSGLRSIADRAALATFQERVQQERLQMLPTPLRELEIVKL